MSNASGRAAFQSRRFARDDSKFAQRRPSSNQNLTRVKFGRMDNISGKTIAITGAARGIGYATAKALLARGARVVIGDRDVALQESAVADLTKLGSVSGYPLDVTDRESFATFLDKARTDGGGHIDVLINNAGVMPIGPFLEQSEQAIRSSIEVNLYGVLDRMPAGAAGHDRPPPRAHHQHRIVVRTDPGSGSGRLRRRQVRCGRIVGRAGRRDGPARRRRVGGDAAVHQHRTHRGHEDQRRRSSRSSPRTSPRRSSRRWRSRRHMCRCRRRCDSPRRPRRCSVLAEGAGSTSVSASTACSWTSTADKRQSYEQRAQPPRAWSRDPTRQLAELRTRVARPVRLDRDRVRSKNSSGVELVLDPLAVPTGIRWTTRRSPSVDIQIVVTGASRPRRPRRPTAGRTRCTKSSSDSSVVESPAALGDSLIERSPDPWRSSSTSSTISSEHRVGYPVRVPCGPPLLAARLLRLRRRDT